MPCPHRRQSGLSLIDVSVAVAIFSVILIAVGNLSSATTNSLDQLGRSHNVDHNLKRALAEVTQDLRMASPTVTTVNVKGS